MQVFGSNEELVNTTTQSSQDWNKMVSLSDGGWVVFYESFSGSNLFAFQQYNADGSRDGGEIQIVNAHTYNGDYDVGALSNGGFWIGTSGNSFLGLNTYNASGQLLNAEAIASPEGAESAVLSNGSWVITYLQNNPTTSYDITQRLYNSDGIFQSEAVLPGSQAGVQWEQHTENLADGRYIIVWNTSDTDGARPVYGVFQQVFNADGTPSGGIMQATPDSTTYIQPPSLIALTNGGWLITWADQWSDRSYQAFAADGSKIGGPTALSYSSQITALADGGWLMLNTTSSSLLQTIYDADGNQVGTQTQVVSNSTYPGGNVTLLADGAWVVVISTDGDIFQKVFDKDGNAITGLEKVNVSDEFTQGGAKTVALEDGGWAISWTGDYSDGSSSGILQRVFRLTHTAPAGTDKTLSTLEDTARAFSAADFGFSDADGDQLAEIILTTLPTVGSLKYNGSTVSVGAHIPASDLAKLVWTPPADQHGVALASIGFKVVDDGSTNYGGVNTDASENHLTLNVTSVNDGGPVLALAIGNQAATENQAFSFAFAADTFSDPDDDTLTYSPTLANGNALPSWLHFNASNRTFSGTPANGDVTTISVVVTASDGSNDTALAPFDITVTNVNDSPTDIAISKNSILENSKPGTVVGILSGVDPDQGDQLTFSVFGNSGQVFAVDGNKLVLDAGKSIDFETKASYQVVVRVTDLAGATYDETFTIKVADVDEPIVGTTKSETLLGTSHGDVLRGLGGNDILVGQGGADQLDGGSGIDIASYLSAKRSVTVDLSHPVKNTGDAAGDKFISIENLVGSNFNDKLLGNNKRNEIDGGRGNDTLTGAGLADTFVLGKKYGTDTVTDFTFKGGSHDFIDLSDAVGISSYKDLMQHHVKQTGNNLTITTDDGSRLLLLDTTIHDLAKGDFLF